MPEARSGPSQRVPTPTYVASVVLWHLEELSTVFASRFSFVFVIVPSSSPSRRRQLNLRRLSVGRISFSFRETVDVGRPEK